MVVDLAGGAVGGGAFRALRGVFERCLAVEEVDAGEDTSGEWTEMRRDKETGEWRLPLELLKLRLHSTSNSNTDDISLSALGLVKYVCSALHDITVQLTVRYDGRIVHKRLYGLDQTQRITFRLL